MRCVIRLAIGFLLLALAIGLAVPEASAKYVHPRGILMETFPRQVLVIWSAAEQVSVQLIVIIMPPFFLNLNYFETVTLKVSLRTWYTTGTGEAPQLLDDTAQWRRCHHARRKRSHHRSIPAAHYHPSLAIQDRDWLVLARPEG